MNPLLGTPVAWNTPPTEDQEHGVWATATGTSGRNVMRKVSKGFIAQLRQRGASFQPDLNRGLYPWGTMSQYSRAILPAGRLDLQVDLHACNQTREQELARKSPCWVFTFPSNRHNVPIWVTRGCQWTTLRYPMETSFRILAAVNERRAGRGPFRSGGAAVFRRRLGCTRSRRRGVGRS